MGQEPNIRRLLSVGPEAGGWTSLSLCFFILEVSKELSP